MRKTAKVSARVRIRPAADNPGLEIAGPAAARLSGDSEACALAIGELAATLLGRQELKAEDKEHLVNIMLWVIESCDESGENQKALAAALGKEELR